MSRPDVRPFGAEHLDPAGQLLAARHAAHRRVEPTLPARFEDPAAGTDLVRATWTAEGASGAVALGTDGHLSGFLLGAPKPPGTWGPNVWVESAGCAVTDHEVARDLYALAAQRWVDEGRTAHYVLLPAHDAALVDAWFRLGFGLQHVHAVRTPDRPTPLARPPSGVTIRRAVRADVPALAGLDLELPLHQARSPVFSSGHLPTLDEAVADWDESIDDPAYTTFVAEADGVGARGRVLGSAIGCALELSGLHTGLARADGAGFLGFAAVLPDARGRGIGAALGEAVIRWSGGEGHPCVVTDWRATNLASSRTWPRLGFRPTFLRLHRLVGY